MCPTSPPVSRYRRTCALPNRRAPSSLISTSASFQRSSSPRSSRCETRQRTGGRYPAAVEAPRYCYRHPDRETGLSCSECGRPICYECMTPAPVGLRCPEHSGKPQGIRKVTAPAQRAVTGVGSRRTNVVTLTLVGINVGVYLAELAAGGSVNGVANYFFNHGALFASGVYSQGSVATLPAHATV